MTDQPSLFELPPEQLDPQPASDEQLRLGSALPRCVRLGTMSWSFAGWRGLVYGANVNVKRLSARGLTAYCRHPLLGCVEIDRSYYEPLSALTFQDMAEQVPEQFRFVVKAHEACTVRRFPGHARYGKKRGEQNSYYLDAGYAADAVVGPALSGLGAKLGVLVFQFPPQDVGEPSAFAAELEGFLTALPRRVSYAVELRNPELLTPAYVTALTASGALHCHNAWGEMPPVTAQAKLIPPVARSPLLIRWLMRRGDNHEGAGARLAPFNRLAEPDVAMRETIAKLVAKAALHDVPTFVVINNKAEGSAPASAHCLAQSIVYQRSLLF